MQPFSRNQRPDLLKAPAAENACYQILFKCFAPAIIFEHARKPLRFAHFSISCASHQKKTSESRKVFRTRQFFALLTWKFGNVLRATTTCTFSTSQLPKVFGPWCALYILTWKCASRHNGVRFFDITTSKSAPTLVWFVHFDFQRCFAPQRHTLFRHLNVQKCSDASVVAHFDFQMCFQMCFAPQRHALFQHLNVQKWSDVGVLCTFWLGNVLRAAKACAFSTSQLPKMLRRWCGLYILTSKCASHRHGVHFFHISTSKDPPTLVWFAHFDFQMCFAPQRRAIFRHLNSTSKSARALFRRQKCSDAVVDCGSIHFDFQMCFQMSKCASRHFWKFAPRALFRHPKVWCGLYILTWKCANVLFRHHNATTGVHFDFQM